MFKICELINSPIAIIIKINYVHRDHPLNIWINILVVLVNRNPSCIQITVYTAVTLREALMTQPLHPPPFLCPPQGTTKEKIPL